MKSISLLFSCAVILDAWMFPLDKNVYGNVEQPVLFINSETFHWKGNIKKISQIIGNGMQFNSFNHQTKILQFRNLNC